MAGEPRDWNAVLQRLLAPFRTEEAAFRVLLWVAGLGAVVIALVLLARAVL